MNTNNAYQIDTDSEEYKIALKDAQSRLFKGRLSKEDKRLICISEEFNKDYHAFGNGEISNE